MRDKLEISINGVTYNKYKRVEINKNIEAIAGSYSITLTQPEIFKFIPGSAMEIKIANQKIISGYAESVEINANESNFEITIQGRDKTGDLVDSSAVFTSSEFLNLSYLQFAEKLTANFGIRVISRTHKANIKFSKITLQQGSVFEELEREARRIGVFLYANNNGDLVISEIGNEITSTKLECPGNILQFSTSVDHSNRFSEYIIKGQQTSAADDSLSAEDQTVVKSKCHDLNITRYRPFVLIADSAVNTFQAKNRIEWEASVRAARSENVNITIEGWSDQSGQLWAINRIARVILQPINLDRFLLIKSVNFKYDELGGQVTDLVLVDEKAYIPEPTISKKELEDTILFK